MSTVQQFKSREMTPAKAVMFADNLSNYEPCTLGCDPEWFLALPTGDRVAAFDVLPPKGGGPIFWDGFQAEAVVDPSGCNQTLCWHIAKRLQECSFEIVGSPIWRVPEVLLFGCAEEHVRLGCDPSINVYGAKGRAVHDGRQLKWRFAGGHIHFGYVTELPLSHKRFIIKQLDALVGVPSVCFAAGIDHPIRRQYYGLAGEFRLPPHGLEWRTLSNYWLFHPLAFHITFDLAKFAHWLGRAGVRTFIGDEETVQNILNYSDVRMAKELMKLNKPLYDAWLDDRYGTIGGVKAFWEAIDGGLSKVISNFGKDVKGAWSLVKDPWKQPLWLKQ